MKKNGQVVLDGTVQVLGTGASPACPACTRKGITRYSLEVDKEGERYYICTPDGCGFTFPADCAPEVINALADQWLEGIQSEGDA